MKNNKFKNEENVEKRKKTENKVISALHYTQ